MKEKPAQKYLLGAIQLFPLLLVFLLVFGGLFLLQTKTGKEIIPLKNAVLSESENEGSDGSDEVEDNDDQDEDEVEDEDNDEDEDEVEDETEDEEEIEEEFEVESGTGEARARTKIKIKTRGSEFQLTEDEIQVESSFPLSVNPETRELTVTTPGGIRVVTILPQQAVENMLAGGVFEVVLKSKTNPEKEEIEIEEEGGKIVYKIEGANQEKVLGLFDVLVPRTVAVSADTGETLGVTQSLLSRLLDLFSF